VSILFLISIIGVVSSVENDITETGSFITGNAFLDYWYN